MSHRARRYVADVVAAADTLADEYEEEIDRLEAKLDEADKLVGRLQRDCDERDGELATLHEEIRRARE